jgi:hypothetical protein
MENMSKAQKEAHEYKDSPMVKLRFILSIYRFLYFCTNLERFNSRSIILLLAIDFFFNFLFNI